jgi:hypothetical protein
VTTFLVVLPLRHTPMRNFNMTLATRTPSAVARTSAAGGADLVQGQASGRLPGPMSFHPVEAASGADGVSKRPVRGASALADRSAEVFG